MCWRYRLIIVIAFHVGFVASFSSGYFYAIGWYQDKPQFIKMEGPSNVERAVTIPEMDVMVHFIKWTRPDLLGYAHPYASTCQVYLPADRYKIQYRFKQLSKFELDDADTVMHEFLHCIVPQWHGE